MLHLEYENDHLIDWGQFLTNYRIRKNKPAEQLVFSAYQVCLDVAERGEGIALGWARSVNSRIKDGTLVRFTELSMHVPDGIAVYRKKHATPHPLATRVIDEVRASIDPIGSTS